MSWASSEVVSILTFLLPGFVAGVIFNSLTSHPKPSDFDRIFQALIFTSLIQALTASALWVSSRISFLSFTEYQHADIILSAVLAIALGLVTSFVFNHDWLHVFLRIIHVTRENSYPSEWYSSFSRNPDCYVVLHLDGERRLYGWPEEWPSQSDKGHFRIAEAEWLLDDGGTISGEGVVAIVVPATEVIMVEFIRAESSED